MKRIFIFSVVILFVISSASLGLALDLSFGVKGGVGLANYIGSDAMSSNDSRLGFSAGAFGEFSLIKMVSLQPEVLFELKGTKVEVSGSKGYNNLYYIDIPVLLKVYPPLPVPLVKIHAFAGPFVGLNILQVQYPLCLKPTLLYNLHFFSMLNSIYHHRHNDQCSDKYPLPVRCHPYQI